MLFNAENWGERACSEVSVRHSGNDAHKRVPCRSEHSRRSKQSQRRVACPGGGGAVGTEEVTRHG